MDTGLLNFGGEHFTTFDPFNPGGPEDSLSIDGGNQFEEWENERELNGDIGLIPVSSSFCQSLKDMTDSPPSEIFQKMIDDWPIEVMSSGHLPHQDDEDVIHNMYNFDLSSFLNDLTPPPVPPPTPKLLKPKAAVKKIDLGGQKYIVDENKDNVDTCDDLIDVETVVEGVSQAVIEAFDPFSLLEQFEASEKPNLAVKNLDEIGKIPPNAPVDIFADKLDNYKDVPALRLRHDVMTAKTDKNQKILEALPKELIARINESGKRKTITVIPPIPNKKRGMQKNKIVASGVQRTVAPIAHDCVRLDHDYCTSSPSAYPKEPIKDSGFESAEEDERSNVFKNQPMVKNSDGKLMVSLLKVNTIRNSGVNVKKKLNLEEYKKRRRIHSAATSRSSSPFSSACSSPLPEDETVKRLKHQEKLMKMAADLLNTPPRKDVEAGAAKVARIERKVREAVVPPPDMEMKTFVSVATNTDSCSASGLLDLEPLLSTVSDRITPNSFITELIETLPKVKCKNSPQSNEDEVVRENKMIYFLKKDRPMVKTASVGVQTGIRLMTDGDVRSRYRRRTTSPSSSSSRSSRSSITTTGTASSGYGRSRRLHRSPSSSSMSSRSTRTSSRSRSRSLSPKRLRYHNAERLREVEERRVVYVGRISAGTTKEDLRRRFRQFGAITNVSLHFRDYGDNYGFVTFGNKNDAYEALEHGNDGFVTPKYDLSFGGRRIFCKTSYSDLDNVRDDDYSYHNERVVDESFDALLRVAQEKLRKRKP